VLSEVGLSQIQNQAAHHHGHHRISDLFRREAKLLPSLRDQEVHARRFISPSLATE
jgi:hypothetical protein